MILNTHIVFPNSGITLVEFKKILASFEEGSNVFCENGLEFESGRILSVKSGSIWIEMFLPIAENLLGYFVGFLIKKLCKKNNKRKFKIELEQETIINIVIEE